MPSYEFVCEKCSRAFSLILSFSEYEKGQIKCPRCFSKKVRQVPTTFIAKTSKKS